MRTKSSKNSRSIYVCAIDVLAELEVDGPALGVRKGFEHRKWALRAAALTQLRSVERLARGAGRIIGEQDVSAQPPRRRPSRRRGQLSTQEQGSPFCFLL